MLEKYFKNLSATDYTNTTFHCIRDAIANECKHADRNIKSRCAVLVSEYEADRAAAEEYAAAVDVYDQGVYADDLYYDGLGYGVDYYDPYNYYAGEGYDGFVDDLGYYP